MASHIGCLLFCFLILRLFSTILSIASIIFSAVEIPHGTPGLPAVFAPCFLSIVMALTEVLVFFVFKQRPGLRSPTFFVCNLTGDTAALALTIYALHSLASYVNVDIGWDYVSLVAWWLLAPLAYIHTIAMIFSISEGCGYREPRAPRTLPPEEILLDRLSQFGMAPPA